MKPTAISIAIVLATFAGSILPKTVGEVFAERGERVLSFGGTALDFSAGDIDSLEGLDAVAAEYPDAQVLFLHGNNISEIPPLAFVGFRNLKWLCLTGNPLNQHSFVDNWDEGLQTLRTISLMDIHRVGGVHECIVEVLPDVRLQMPKPTSRSAVLPKANPFELSGSQFDDWDTY